MLAARVYFVEAIGRCLALAPALACCCHLAQSDRSAVAAGAGAFGTAGAAAADAVAAGTVAGGTAVGVAGAGGVAAAGAAGAGGELPTPAAVRV